MDELPWQVIYIGDPNSERPHRPAFTHCMEAFVVFIPGAFF